MTAADWVKALSVALILVMSAAIGMRVTFAEVINSFQQTRLMIKGLVANFLLTPLVTLALVQLFHAPPLLAAGFLIMSACPGANLGPPCTTMAKGDLPSAISMMIAFAALSPLLAPALLLVLLAGIPGGQGLHIDFVTIVVTLIVTQILPLALALAFHHWKPAVASKLVSPLTLLFNALLVAMVAASIYSQYEDLIKFRYVFWLGMAFLIVATLIIGWLLGGPKNPTRKSMALSTVGRNSAVALVIASTNFPDSLAVVAIVVYGLVQTIVGLGVALALAKIP